MEVGEKITFPFGKKQMEGTVYKVFEKTVYLQVDFPRHKGKIIKRKLAELQGKKEKKKQGKKEKKKKK